MEQTTVNRKITLLNKQEFDQHKNTIGRKPRVWDAWIPVIEQLISAGEGGVVIEYEDTPDTNKLIDREVAGIRSAIHELGKFSVLTAKTCKADRSITIGYREA